MVRVYSLRFQVGVSVLSKRGSLRIAKAYAGAPLQSLVGIEN